MKTINEEIETFVALSGLSRYQLSKESGISQTLLSRFKTGKQTDTSSSKVRAIYAAMRRLNPEAAAKALEDHNG